MTGVWGDQGVGLECHGDGKEIVFLREDPILNIFGIVISVLYSNNKV